MTQALSDEDWVAIHAGVVADVAKRRADTSHDFQLIPLADLVQHGRLPIHQSIDGLVDWSAADLSETDRIPLFISHRWPGRHEADDGSMIARILAFCLSVILKNNLHHLTPPIEVHHSEHLSSRLNALLGSLTADQVLQESASFGRFETVLCDAVPDPGETGLVRSLLARFHIWIDYCCLPQEAQENGSVVERTPAEDERFLSGLDAMDTLLQHAESALLWSPSEITRAWLFYEAMMTIPPGRASFATPMELVGALSTVVRQHHASFSKLGLMNSLMMVDAFKRIGITATSHRDIRKLIFLMSENLAFTEWNFRVIS